MQDGRRKHIISLRHDTTTHGTYLAINNDSGQLQAATCDMPNHRPQLDAQKTAAVNKALLQVHYSIIYWMLTFPPTANEWLAPTTLS